MSCCSGGRGSSIRVALLGVCWGARSVLGAARMEQGTGQGGRLFRGATYLGDGPRGLWARGWLSEGGGGYPRHFYLDALQHDALFIVSGLFPWVYCAYILGPEGCWGAHWWVCT
jgi:hypothetical protein